MTKGTPLRNVRVPDDRWTRARARAIAEGTTVSALINAWLEEYADATRRVTRHAPR